MRFLMSCLVLLALSACGYVNYKDLKAGSFSGAVHVYWVGENNTAFGDGNFVYVPVRGQELTFTRTRANGEVQVIRPEPFYTDGGSVPKPLQSIGGMSAWGYAPAYIIHDWLFVARKCVNDGKQPTAHEVEIVGDMSFQESADIMGETIKTLIESNRVKRRDLSPVAISWATAGPVSRNLWNEETCVRLHPTHLANIQHLIGDGRLAGIQARSKRNERTGGPQLVGTISFD